jgi:hypothetical protein
VFNRRALAWYFGVLQGYIATRPAHFPGLSLMKEAPVVAGASLSLYSIIAGEMELMGHANSLV